MSHLHDLHDGAMLDLGDESAAPKSDGRHDGIGPSSNRRIASMNCGQWHSILPISSIRKASTVPRGRTSSSSIRGTRRSGSTP